MRKHCLPAHDYGSSTYICKLIFYYAAAPTFFWDAGEAFQKRLIQVSKKEEVNTSYTIRMVHACTIKYAKQAKPLPFASFGAVVSIDRLPFERSSP
jgi:hypothetical protein